MPCTRFFTVTTAMSSLRAISSFDIGKEGKGGLYETPETVLTDLLCDMRHHADLKGFDFGTCNARAASLYGEEADEEIGNQFGLRCPECRKGDAIDIAATVWVRLCPDGTDVTAAEDADHEWENMSTAKCCACGYCASVGRFKVTP